MSEEKRGTYTQLASLKVLTPTGGRKEMSGKCNYACISQEKYSCPKEENSLDS
jgi:hypothetical protein